MSVILLEWIHSCSIRLPMAFNRDGDGKSAAPGFPGRRTLQIYFTAVVFYNFMNDCQSQSGAFFPGRKKRVKDFSFLIR
jgi:hypothetical protein